MTQLSSILNRMFLVGLMALAVLAVMASPVMAKERPRKLVHGKTYVQILDRETISHIASDEHVSSKSIMRVNHIRDVRRVRAGRWIYVPRTTEKHSVKIAPRATRKERANRISKPTPVVRYRSVQLKVVDEFKWKHVTGNPLKVHAPSDYEQIMVAMGYPQDVSHRIALRLMYGDPDGAVIIDKDGSAHRIRLSPNGIASDFTMGSMASGSGTVKHLARRVVNSWRNRDRLAAWLFYEKNGGDPYWYVALVKDCKNLVELRPVPITARETPSSEKPIQPPEIGLPPEQEKAAQHVGWLWGIEAFAGGGGVYPDKGGHTYFSFWEAVGYPYIRDTKDGRYMLGIGIAGGLCEGKVPPIGFQFNCDYYDPGLYAKYIDWKHGWDIRLSLFWGHLHEYGHTPDRRYDSRRDIEHMGFGINYNNYQRELDGKDTFTEWQIWARIAPWILDVNAKNSFDRRPISNHDLKKHFGLVSAGLRVFYKNWNWRNSGWPRGIRFGTGAEYFGELPQSESLTVWALVLSDTDKIVFASFGRSIDVGGGTDGWIWSFGIDLSQAVRTYEGYARRLQLETFFKNYDPASGTFININSTQSPEKGEEVYIPTDISIH